jgi:threonine dehydratase
MAVMDLVTLADVRAAADHLKGVAVRTPIVPAPWAGGDLWVKPETLQPVGAFKLRGAYHSVAALPDDVRARGVLCHSSGNHGRALAYSARIFGVPAVVVMPNTSPQVKIDAIRALGGEVIIVAPPERGSVMDALAAERGLAVVPPFDHRNVIAGQGTIGLEIVEDAPATRVILVPVGGGGLASGVATAAKALDPTIKVYGVEPEFAAETKEGLESGTLTTWSTEETYRTMADGVRTAPSDLTFAHMIARLDGIVTVSEAEIGRAVGRLAREAKLVVETSGALSVAAYLSRRDQLPEGPTVAVLTGGNIDPKQLAELIIAG